ncbi:MAG: rRNA maturation RNase YbeY [Oscillospiraceae bacterium]|nr:rRNA maturation RNase YbeY [Oscillospiraceae bacterium]
MTPRIFVRHEKVKTADRLPIPTIKRIIRGTLKSENVHDGCEVSVLVTNNSGIMELNSKYRGLDAPTDVLSFPAYELEPGHFAVPQEGVFPETGRIPLGDVVLSVEYVNSQAEEYEHSVEWETARLIVHAVLHLLGYDHEAGADARQMRMREAEILLELGYRE